MPTTPGEITSSSPPPPPPPQRWAVSVRDLHIGKSGERGGALASVTPRGSDKEAPIYVRCPRFSAALRDRYDGEEVPRGGDPPRARCHNSTHGDRVSSVVNLPLVDSYGWVARNPLGIH